MGMEDLQSSLTSPLKVPSLPYLTVFTKLQVSTDSQIHLGIEKGIRRLGKASFLENQDQNPKCIMLSSCWHPKGSSELCLNQHQTAYQEIKVEGFKIILLS